MLGDEHRPVDIGPGGRPRQQVGVSRTGLLDDVELAPTQARSDQVGTECGYVQRWPELLAIRHTASLFN